MSRVYITLPYEVRLERHTDKLGPLPDRRPELGNCWVWRGSHNGHGYGLMRHKDGNFYVHRLSYELNIGPIPDGLEIDHLCRNPGCLRPEHLEPVTPQENHRRARLEREARQCLQCGQEFTTPVTTKRRYCSLECSAEGKRRPLRPCTVPGCERLSHSNGICEGHRWRMRHYGAVFSTIPLIPGASKHIQRELRRSVVIRP